MITGALAIVGVFLWSYFAKQDLIKSGTITEKSALHIDYLVIIIYGSYCLTLMSALVIFKVLDRRHSIKIKKFQLSICFLLTTCAVSLSVL